MRTIKQVVERVDSWLVIVQLVEVLMMEEDMEMVAIMNMEDNNLVLSYFHCSDFIYIRICLEIVRQFDLMILLSGVVILHIENKSAPLRGQKIINLPQNRTMNFQKFPYF